MEGADESVARAELLLARDVRKRRLQFIPSIHACSPSRRHGLQPRSLTRMATHVGIELSPSACRIVEIVATTNARIPETRVGSWAVTPPGGVEMSVRLASLRRRSVAVVVWGTKCDHRQVMVEPRSYDKMKAEAIRSARQAGVDSDGMLTDIAPVKGSLEGARRRAVLLAMAASRDVAASVGLLRAAGLRIRSVVTPADALTSLIRMRRTSSVPDAIEAYVALDQTSTAIALVRNGALMASRELAWGFGCERLASGEMRPRDEIAMRTADALTDFFLAVGAARGSVRQVSICGPMPELRGMTIPLMERLDLEVEPLDSLVGIDLAHLPPQADEFRDRSAELRLAWAVAADWRAPINLLRERRRQEAKTAIGRAAVVAGVVAGLGVGWRIQRSQLWQTTAGPVGSVPAPKAIARTTPPSQLPVLPLSAPPFSPPKQVAPPNSPQATRTPSAVPSAPPPLPAPRLPALRPEPASRVDAPTHRVTGPAAGASVLSARGADSPSRANVPAGRTGEAPRSTDSARTQLVTPSVVQPRPSASESEPVSPPSGAAPPAPRRAPVVLPPLVASPRVVLPPRSSLSPLTPARPERQAVPSPQAFDAVLSTILYSPDRKLAIIDGRIVGPGDDVRGARVVDITPNSVQLLDAQGRMRILALGAGAR